MLTRYAIAWDRAGVALSTLCLVHCTVLPLVFLLLPSLAITALGSDRAHVVLAAALLGISAAAFIPGYLRHRRRAVPLLGAFGWTSVVAAAGAETLGHSILGGLVTVIGSTALIAAHRINRSACAQCTLRREQRTREESMNAHDTSLSIASRASPRRDQRA